MKNLKFKNGDSLPTIGLGTWKSKKDVVKNAVIDAIKAGYRHIDCAAIYGNEKEIGEALHHLFSSGIVQRKDLFITSKLWNDHHKSEDVKIALEQTLEDLQLEYINLYLMHWPIAMKKDSHPPEFISLDETPLIETWDAMIQLKNKKLCRHVGTSNFSIKKLTHINENSSQKIELNQVEIHPFFPQNKLKNFCDEKEILMTAYSPLGSADRSEGFKKNNEPKPLSNKEIINIAENNNCTPAQVLIAWIQSRDIAAIPKSTNKNRIEENLAADSIDLGQNDIDKINQLDMNYRLIDGSLWTNNPYYSIENLWDD